MTNEIEFAYQLLLSLPTSSIARFQERINPLLHRDFLNLLPYELSLHVLSFLDVGTILSVAQVSKHCARLANDNNLWKGIYFRDGWSVNQRMIDWYLSHGVTRTPETSPRMEEELALDDYEMEEGNSEYVVLDDVHMQATPTSSASATATAPLASPLSPRHRRVDSAAIMDFATTEPELDQRTTLPGPPNFPFAPSAYLPHDLNIHRDNTGKPMINWRYLYRQRVRIESRWKAGNYRIRELPGHSEGIYCIQFDEYKIVSGSRDNTIKIWDIRTGFCIKTYTGHQASVLCLQYDDEIIVSGSSDASIIMWDLQSGKSIRILSGHRESVLNLRFDRHHIVSCSKDRTIKIWDRQTGACLRTLNAYEPNSSPSGHRAAVNAVQFIGDTIVSASGDRTIKLWSLGTGECLRTVEGHTRGIACIQFDGKVIVSGSSDKTIKMFDAANGECIRTLEGHTELVRTLQFDNHRIVSGSYDETLKIWDMETGRLLVDLPNGHSKM